MLRCKLCNSDLTGAVAVIGDRETVDAIHKNVHMNEALDVLVETILNTPSRSDLTRDQLIDELINIRRLTQSMKDVIDLQTIFEEEENG
jgi:hypothetical protein